MTKTISILIPAFNEEENVLAMYEALVSLFRDRLSAYNYEIVFIENCSEDSTRAKIRGLCERDANVKAIFNARNFGPVRSPYYGILQTTGDCTVAMACDFQDPVEVLPQFVAEWEQGCRIVIGVKSSSEENRLMYFLRSKYYGFVRRFSDVEQIQHFTGFGLYDKSFVEIMRKLEDPFPYFRGIVAELGFERKEISYVQPKRRAGKTSVNWYRLYSAGMLGVTAYTNIGLRAATMIGFITAACSFLIGLVYLVYKLLYWKSFPMGSAPILIGMFFLGAVQLFFIGVLGEYILGINTRIMKRPLVIEEQRLNFRPPGTKC